MPAPDSRPLLHVRPDRGWLNDPNGTVRHDGRWHVFFQHNPARAQHGDIHWGHASSADLVTWTSHPVAFGPTPGGPDAGGCWSGAHLSWLGEPAVVYSGVADGPADSTVCLRRALDDRLDTWSEPVVVATTPTGAGIHEMRDPYPFEHGGRRFALLGAGLADGTPAVLLLSCDDPLAWRYEGVWLDGHDPVAARVAPANIWECPQLVDLGDEGWLLVLSLWRDHVLEDVVHLRGTLEPDGDGLPRLRVVDGGRLDEGPDFYAPQVLDDGSADPLVIGWVRQQGAPNDAPPETVVGCLTFPRRLTVRDGQVSVRPDERLAALVGEPVTVEMADGRLDLPARALAHLRSHGAPAQVTLRAGEVVVPVTVDGAGVDVWLDGEVAETYRPAGPAGTARCPGAGAWSLTGALDACDVAVHALRLPG